MLQHEHASLAMFDHMVKVNHLEPVMKDHGLVLPEDLDFIKEQIAGPLDSNADEKVSSELGWFFSELCFLSQPNQEERQHVLRSLLLTFSVNCP